MASKNCIKLKLVSTATNEKGKPTGTYYTTTKNKKTTGEKKLQFKKYDRLAYNKETGKRGFHVIFKEDKIK